MNFKNYWKIGVPLCVPLWMVLGIANIILTACNTEQAKAPAKGGAAPSNIKTQKDAVQTSTALCDFAIYAEEQTLLRDRVTSWDGYIGAAGNVDIGNDAVINGDVESVGQVVLRDRARVNGNVTTGDTIAQQSGATISGVVDEHAAVAPFAIPRKWVLPGSNSVYVYSGQSTTLPPGRYDNVITYGGGTLTLTAGRYQVRQFIVEATGAHLNIDISGGAVVVNVAKMLRFGNQMQMTVEGGADARQVRFYSNQTTQVMIGTNSAFYGTVTAPFGEIYAYSGMTFEGALYGKRVTVDADITFHGLGCADPCDGVTCDDPPADVCVDADSLRDYDDTGVCTAGVCDYPYTDTLCPNGCENGACNVSQCDSGACCDNGVLRPAGVECRAGAGDCDVAEVCDGASPECPADGFASSSTECRAAAGICDVVETCDGVSAECPADEFASSGTECRPSADVCDVAEVCDGTSAVCPSDGLASSGIECRASAGECDVAEVCDNLSAACPADELVASGTECRGAAGVCDVVETCDGSSAVCPVDEVVASGTECRGAAGACDVAETCDGASVACPPDGFASSGTECRAPGGLCDVAETCNGASAECPADEIASSGTECRASAGDCDVAEACDGASSACPADELVTSGTECRGAVGVCDVAETCDGSSAVCPADELANSGTECRASAGICDLAETCNGVSTECPADEFASATTECRASSGICDIAETCDGSSAVCPPDELASPSTECRASAGICDVAEMCDGALADCPADELALSGTECRASAGECDVAEVCDGSSAACPADELIAAGTECRGEAGVCDEAEACDGLSSECPTDGFVSSGTECRASAGFCDVVETCDGASPACPADGFASSGTACRAAAGMCDVAETCDGASAACPPDVLASASTECRASAGECDVAETCDGVSLDCPDDQKSTAECRPVAGLCDVAEVCDGVSDYCPVDAYLPSTELCDGVPVDAEYDCSGADCGADALIREQFAYCTGSDADCNGNNLVWHDWEVDSDCDESSVCLAEATGAECAHCDFGCETGGCIDPCEGMVCDAPPEDFCVDANTRAIYPSSGTCVGGTCDYAYQEIECEHGCENGVCRACSSGACCGEDGVVLGSETRCGTVPVNQEYGCSTDECGGDAIRREQYQYCSGLDSECGMNNLVWEEWTTIQSCYTYGHCVNNSADSWCENCEFGCAVGECNIALPPDPETVAPDHDPTRGTRLLESTSFLYTGDDPIQKGLDSSIIEEQRVTVLRGRILNRDGTPLSGVTVTLLDHPEYGSTVSRTDGQFDLVANGGGRFVVNYEKEDYLNVQRKVKTPWEDYVQLPEVVMIHADSVANNLDLSGTSQVTQIAEGSEVIDDRGIRRPTLLIPPNTTAEMVMKDGSRYSLDTMDLRMTEYTVGDKGPETMPGELPPTTMYTYAIELDGDYAAELNAKSIEFSAPVYMHLDNFLEYPAGVIIPVGYYDKEKAAWVPGQNGVVVELVDIVDGEAVLDAYGDGSPLTPEIMEWMGITSEELTLVAQKYSVGDTFWRMPINHFSPYDFNHPIPFWIAEDDDSPEPYGDDPDPDDKCEQSGSRIYCTEGAVGESVRVPGTDLTLNYRSDRVGNKKTSHRLRIPVPIQYFCSNDSVSGSPIVVEVGIAGRNFRYEPCCETDSCTDSEKSCSPAFSSEELCVNGATDGYRDLIFDWDGFDVYGRPVVWAQNARITTTRAVDSCYLRLPTMSLGDNPGEGFRFGGFCTASECRTVYSGSVEMCMSNTRSQSIKNVALGGIDRGVIGLGGWALDKHHIYDIENDVLYLGSGEKRAVERYGPMVRNIEVSDWYGPLDIAVAPDGSVYHFGGDHENNAPTVLVRWDPETNEPVMIDMNIVDTEEWERCILATGQWDFDRLTFAPNGDLYFTATGLERGRTIWRMDMDGNVTLAAGCGDPNNLDIDGIDATDAWIDNVYTIEFDSDGRMIIGQAYRVDKMAKLKMVDTDGKIWTIAKESEGAPLNLVWGEGLAVGPDDSIYVLESRIYGQPEKLWRLTPSGEWINIIDNVNCNYEEGAPVEEACIRNGAWGITVSDTGDILYSENQQPGSARIRGIFDGYVRTIAGNGEWAVSQVLGDRPALQTPLPGPEEIAIAPDGKIYFDLSNGDPGNSIACISQSSTEQIGDTFVVPNDDASEIYVFDATGRHLKTRDAMTGAEKYDFSYDESGYLLAISDSHGMQTTIQRDSAGNVTGIIAPDIAGLPNEDRTTQLTLDSNGNLENIGLPNGSRYVMESTADGLMTSFRDPNGNQTKFNYDTSGRFLSDEDAVGSTKRISTDSPEPGNYIFTFQSGEDLTTVYELYTNQTDKTKGMTVTFPDGTENTSTRKRNGETTTSFANGMTVETTLGSDPRFGMRAPYNAVTKITTPGGIVKEESKDKKVVPEIPYDLVTFDAIVETNILNEKVYTKEYDSALQRWSYTSPEGRKYFEELDEFGRITKVWADGFEEFTFSYNSHGKLNSIQGGTGTNIRTYEYTYDELGYLQSIVDPIAHSTMFENDELGQVLIKWLPDGQEIHFTYDANGNTTSITPPGKPTHGFEYTKVDLLEEYAPPSLTGIPYPRTFYTYNLDRQVTRITRPDGQEINYVYDSAGRISTIDMPGLEQLSYFYNSQTGMLGSLNSSNGETLTYTYDGSLLTSTELSGTVFGTITNVYNNDFSIVTRDVNAQSPASFTYDDDGFLESAGTLDLILDPVTGLLDGTRIGTITTNNTYNGFGELDSESYQVDDTPVYEASFVRDKLGRITSKTEQIQGATTLYEYTYNINGRLTDVYLNGDTDPASHYDYDDNGNRVSFQDYRSGTALVQNGTYDDQDRMESYGNASDGYTEYTYTANGELQTKTLNGETTQYTYDVLGNLRTVNLPDGTLVEYIIDGENRRVGKAVNGTLEQGLLYKDALNPIAELNGSGNIVSRFVYGSKFNVPDYFTSNKLDGSTWQTYRIISNHLGSPRMVVNTETGEVVQRIDYDEFGRVLEDTNPGFQPFGFAGGLYDEETGLVRFGARDYDGETGRWTTKDPILFGGGINLYGYVLGDSVNGIDPSGLSKYDKLFGLPKRFWNWYHRKVKRRGDPDLGKEEADELYDEWRKLDKPGPDNNKNKRKRNSNDGWEDWLDLFIPLPDFLHPCTIVPGDPYLCPMPPDPCEDHSA